jgi:phosphopantothenoylcysteine synthetase/decarboxylase
MRLLVTAGNTLAPIDRVRCITNIFTGRTGTAIALQSHGRGHMVTLLTSHPQVVAELAAAPPTEEWKVLSYRTFDELQILMKAAATENKFDAVIHCAAVSDYRSGGIYAPAPGTSFRQDLGQFECSGSGPPVLVDRAAGKIKSDESELWLRLVRTPKLIDLIRSEWGYQGILVKFKLEVGSEEDQLLKLAELSRRQSAADFMVANTLEEAALWAYVGPMDGSYRRVNRHELADCLLQAIEQKYEEQQHG